MICGECGHVVDDEGDRAEREPCPKCGARRRKHEENLGDGIRAGDFSGVVGSDASGDTKFVDETRPGGDAHSADDRDGMVEERVAGKPPDSQEAELEVCERLARHWSQSGQAWLAKRVPDTDDPGDCILIGQEDGQTRAAQVTAAVPGRSFFGTLAHEGERRESASPEDAAERLLAAAEMKSGKYPKKVREDLLLVLDASRAPAGVLRSVLAAAAERRSDFRGLGFAQVWVVGPLGGLVHRLDA